MARAKFGGTLDDEYERYRADAAASYMEHVRSLGLRMRSLQEEIERERSLMLPQGLEYSPQPGNPNAYGDAIPDGLSRLQAMVEAYCAELAGYVAERQEAHEAVSRIARPERREALRGHYLAGKTWERVCVDMGYSYDGMMKLRRGALCELYDLMPHRWRDPLHRAI